MQVGLALTSECECLEFTNKWPKQIKFLEMPNLRLGIFWSPTNSGFFWGLEEA